ncbi:hypothetical protein [Marinifilum fragile]|uniref:hypothetical protein n=1 Tax=Marinifilum fragile TaxID=570161 RepID=UPI002AA64AB0|nr:hypothetical protein [Marinifilum fragile]
MDAAIWGFIGTIVGAVVGASASILTTSINGRNASKLQFKAEKYKRDERFREFQRENLLKLQNTLSNSMRLLGRAHLEDLNNFKAANKWRSQLLSEELDEEIRVSFRDLSILTERVSNDDLRKDLNSMKELMTSYILTQTKEEAEIQIQKSADDFTITMTKLGHDLRTLYN